jgi:hypothetical protein
VQGRNLSEPLARHFNDKEQEGRTMGVARLCLAFPFKRAARAHADRGLHSHARPALTLAAAAIGGLVAVCAAPSPSIAQTLKAPLSGLVSMGSTQLSPGGIPVNDLSPIQAEPGIFNGVVINIGWDALQPTQTTLDTSTIDTALAAVAAYNAKYPKTPLGVRLNVEASLLAPGWVKTMDGPAVVTLDQSNGSAPPTVFTIGRFWNLDYQAAWTRLQTRLAGKYDTNPLINEISNTACSSVTDEPFVLITSSLAISNMHAAGFTDAKYLACLETSISFYAAWRETPMHWAFNPFEHTDAGYEVVDETTTQDIIKSWRAKDGAKAILANHDLQSGTLNGVSEAEYPNIALMYQQFKQLGGLINLQSNTAVQDWTATIPYGISKGATDIEFWPGTAAGYLQSSVSKAQLLKWSAELEANREAVAAYASCSGGTCTGAGL